MLIRSSFLDSLLRRVCSAGLLLNARMPCMLVFWRVTPSTSFFHYPIRFLFVLFLFQSCIFIVYIDIYWKSTMIQILFYFLCSGNMPLNETTRSLDKKGGDTEEGWGGEERVSGWGSFHEITVQHGAHTQQLSIVHLKICEEDRSHAVFSPERKEQEETFRGNEYFIAFMVVMISQVYA